MILFRYFILFVAIIFSNQLIGQNCTINAGFDGGRCIAQPYPPNSIVEILQLNGNSDGNLSANPNLLWEVASAPVGSALTFTAPSNNYTQVNANISQLPSGIYIFRLGINCLSGERIYDSVTFSIVNISDFNLFANKAWSSMC